MTSNALFSEKQRFNQVWIWLVLAGSNATFLYGLYKQLVLHTPFGDNPMSDTALIISASLMLLFSVLIRWVSLQTIINAQGIYVRFYPFQRSYRAFPWEAVTTIQVRTYDPIGEYGGWGYRIGFGEVGKAYNVAGNQGIQLILEDQSRFLIGTQKPTEAAEVLLTLGKLAAI